MDGKNTPHLVFDPGTLVVRVSGYGERDGSGFLQFDEDDAEFIPQDDGSSDIVQIALPASEIIALRDFLNKLFPETRE